MQEQINRLTDHYIVCGYGRMGHRLAEDLFRANRPFVVIERSETVIQDEMTEGMLYLVGDAEDDAPLQRAGLDRAEGVIIALPDDSLNVFVPLTVCELNPDIYILTRTVDHKNRRKLLRAGADKVIAPSEVGADRMA